MAGVFLQQMSAPGGLGIPNTAEELAEERDVFSRRAGDPEYGSDGRCRERHEAGLIG